MKLYHCQDIGQSVRSSSRKQTKKREAVTEPEPARAVKTRRR